MSSGKRSRLHSIVTYANKKQVDNVISQHATSIRAFCYILHDKDETVPHIHLVMRTYCTWTDSAICKWFKGLKDSKKEEVNTFSEAVSDATAIIAYLTHSDHESREKGKYQYSKDEICDFGICDIIPHTEAYDTSYDVVNDILAHTDVRTLIRKYGRDYIFHRTAYEEVSHLIQIEEGYNASLTKARAYQNHITQPNFEDTEEDLDKIF